ncbi:hypothetical protein SAMN04487967_3135 [Natronorubrum sediminis]|uniref:Kinase n=1 Tax=Natronorubrum sediminis TaxID=640943 RepID=A0A1H6G2V3_9EURY|nr:AAA family ATPase [Natronorubrum sediminis]SEH17379.1 hypothetical protein SAMN04487967_3135 [Natronorubrum sediminis]
MTRPTLLVYCGLPGVGKSMASSYTADRFPATRYRSDAVRKQLFSDPSYTADESAATYEELLSRGRNTLEADEHVVLDATFQSKETRDAAATVAAEADAEIRFVHVTCALEVVKERIESRTETISDAEFEQHMLLRESFDPLEREHVVIDNSETIEETHDQLERLVL